MIGNLIRDRYQVEAELGQGGMGVVYRARDNLLNRNVAVKVMSDSEVSQDGRARLLQEGRAAAGLNHPNIVTIYDVVEDGETLFIIMELVAGKPLNEVQVESLDSILEISLQVCAALVHAHQNNIIHRDLKPENVLIVDHTAKLMDFGLARSMSSRLSIEGDLMGTAYYLAPEQALGSAVDERTDLYSLGVMMYEMVTGRLPFTAQDTLAVISQHLYAPVVPPRTYNKEISSALNDLILRMMAKSPAERPESAGEVFAVLEQIKTEDEPAEIGFEIDLLQQIIQGRLVGRQNELEILRRHWFEAQQGHAQLVLISGEPGVGKTRLANEVTAYARLHGGVVFKGGCYEYEAKSPYLPFAEALRDWVHAQSSDMLQAQLGDSATELAKLAPEIEALLGPLPPNPSLDPEQERLRMYDHLARFLQNLAAEKGLLFFIDDLHWADRGTLSLVHYLLRRLRKERVMILGGYREVELDRAHPLSASIVEWNRERLATRVQLGRLSKEDCAELLAGMFEQEEITSEFVDAIFNETEGNPFFIEEVIKSLVDQGKIYRQDNEWQREDIDELGIPQSIKEAIGRRLDRLSPQSSEALQYAAILGKTFEFNELLTAYLDGDQNQHEQEDTLLDALDEALNAQLLKVLQGETFEFTHDKIRETLYEEMNAIRKRRLHLKLAKGLEVFQRSSSQKIKYPELAYHYIHGGDLEKGMEFAILAGEQARNIYAYDEALQYYLEAAESAESLGHTEQLGEIFGVVGALYVDQGLFDKAVETFHQALEYTTNAEQQARLKMMIGSAYANVGDVRGLEYLKTAQAELNPDTQAVELVEAMGWIGRYYHYQAQHKKAIEVCKDALPRAKSLHQPGILLNLYAFLAGSHQHILDYEQAIYWAKKCITLGEEEDMPGAVAIGHEFQAESDWRGYWEQGIQHTIQDQEYGDKYGAQDRVAWAKYVRSMNLHGSGQLARALEDAMSSLEDAQRIGEQRLAIWVKPMLAFIQIDLDLDAEAEANIMQAIQEADDMDQVVLQCWSRAAHLKLLIKRAEWSQAMAVYEKAKELYTPTENLLGRSFIGDYAALVFLGAGRQEEAQAVLDEQMQLIAGRDMPHNESLALRTQGQIYADLGAFEEAEKAYSEAISIQEQINSRLELGRSYFLRSRLLEEGGKGEEAIRDSQIAIKLFEECGAVYDLRLGGGSKKTSS